MADFWKFTSGYVMRQTTLQMFVFEVAMTTSMVLNERNTLEPKLPLRLGCEPKTTTICDRLLPHISHLKSLPT